jgi:glycosyltransferase involved in cell wall biosynthesis
MADEPLVSCVIPVLDGERYLAAAIDSVLAQDHAAMEVLVVVDLRTTDRTPEIVASYGDRVRMLECDRPSAPAGRNTGVAAATGAFIGFLDADDLYLPHKTSLQLAHFAARPELGVSLCTFENFWEPGLEQEAERYRVAGRLRASYVCGTLLARPWVFERVGALDESLPTADAADWFARLAECDDVVSEVLPDVAVARRMHAASLTHQAIVHDPWLDLLKRRIDDRRAER